MARRPEALLATLALGAVGCSPTVSPQAGAAACTVRVTPPSGSLATTFTAELASMNATMCTWSIDGKRTIPIKCMGTFTATGAESGDVGTHTLVVTATGLAGVGTCSATWTVVPPVFDLAGPIVGADLAAGPPDMAAPGDQDMAGAPVFDLAMAPPAPDLATPPKTLDLHDATLFNNPMKLADWPETTKITNVTFQPNGQDGVHVEFSKRDGPGRWPDITPPGWDGSLEYTLGMAELINGQWYASAAIQFWYGLDLSGGNVAANNQVAKNWFYDGRWGALAGNQPAKGEIIGIFVVAGNVRNVLDEGSQSPVHERSNVVLVPMPDVNGATYSF